MAGEDVIWHVTINAVAQGPLTKEGVLERLRDGALKGTDLIWRPGFAEWKPVSELNDFWQPPPVTPGATSPTTVSPPPLPDVTLPAVTVPAETVTTEPAEFPARRKWSLWKSANIGMILGAALPVVQITSGNGYRLASHANALSASNTEAISYIIAQILTVPLILVLLVGLLNVFWWRRRPSNASITKGALVFVVLLACYLGAFKAYGTAYFSGSDTISGEARDAFITDSSRACIQKQRASAQGVTEIQIQRYCGCVVRRMADNFTYKHMGSDPDAATLDDLKKKTEAASKACG